MKKTYEVEVRYTAYTTITVEADNEDEAERLAYRELVLDGDHRSSYGDWTLESVEEIEGESE
jgi:hypothetical protein